MRRRPVVHATEAGALRCATCNSCYSISQTIDAALERGFQRCFGRSKLSEDETKISAFLQAQPIQTNINKKGQVFSVIHDYVYRNHFFDDMNFWTFIASQKIVARKDQRANV